MLVSKILAPGIGLMQTLTNLPFEYYITRSLFFVEKGGYLVVVYPPNKEKSIYANLDGLNGIIEKNIKSSEFSPDYGGDGLNILIIKKIK